MHPAVEVPHPHEPSVGVRTCRRRSDLVPVSISHARKRLAPLGSRGAELLEQVGRADAAQLAHPALVHHADVVADMFERRDVDVGVRRRSALQHRLGAYQVGRHIMDGPTRQRSLRLPLVVGQGGEHRVGLVPHGEQSVEDVGLIERSRVVKGRSLGRT